MAIATRPTEPTNDASGGADSSVRPFRVEFPEEQLADLRRRITAMRWPGRELVMDASQGVQLATLQAVAKYWATEHDWRATEAKLNALPEFTTRIDGLDIHFIHVKSKHENALPLIITHGWPGSVIEMLEAIGPLTDPTAHGGTAADAFHVVIPSLPGYGFSGIPTEQGWGAGRIASAWHVLMTRLGYTRYVAQGGDQGASVTDALGRAKPDGLLGIHLNLLSAFPLEVSAAIFGEEFSSGLVKRVVVAAVASRADMEKVALAKVQALFTSGYLSEMNTRPQTIGYGIADPIGMAAWFLDHDADSYAKISRAFVDGVVTGNLSRDRIADNLTLYWLTNTATSAARLYWENFQVILAAISSNAKPPELSVPTAFTVFPQEIFQAPRRWAEKVYPNLVYFNEAPKGGHFAAWEEPEVFATELRAAFRTLR